MKKNSFLFLCISCIFSLGACEEKQVDITTIPTKDKQGYTQILVATPSQSKNHIAFDHKLRNFNKTEQSYFLTDIAHTGYIVGKASLQKAIVLGKTAKTGSLISTLPIGLAKIISEENTTEWHIFADADLKINNFEDFTLNHFALRSLLQQKLQQLDENKEVKIIWYDEEFLELKISEAL